MNEWSSYAINLTKQLGIKGTHSSKPIGNQFSEEDLENFSEEQIMQLHELFVAASTDPTKDQTNKEKT